MHPLNSEWRLVVAGLVVCIVISFLRAIMGKRGAACFDVLGSLLTIGLLAYVLLHAPR